MALGSTIGGILGTVGGAALTAATAGAASPLIPALATAGSAIGAGVGGGIDAIAAKGKKKKALGELPDMVDPMEANRYNELRLREKQLMTGTAFQTALGENRKAQAATIQGVNQASGGAGGAAIAAMLRADTAAGRTNNETLGKGLEQQNFLTQEMSALSTRIAQRKFALQKQKYQQDLYDASAAQGEANSDLKAQAARIDFNKLIDMIGKGLNKTGGIGGSNTTGFAGGLTGIAPSQLNIPSNGLNLPYTGIGSVLPQNQYTGYTPNFSWNQPPPNFNTGGLEINTGVNPLPKNVPFGINNTPSLNIQPITPVFNGGATQVASAPVQPAPQSSSVILQQPQVVSPSTIQQQAPQTAAPPQTVTPPQTAAPPQTVTPPTKTTPVNSGTSNWGKQNNLPKSESQTFQDNNESGHSRGSYNGGHDEIVNGEKKYVKGEDVEFNGKKYEVKNFFEDGKPSLNRIEKYDANGKIIEARNESTNSTYKYSYFETEDGTKYYHQRGACGADFCFNSYWGTEKPKSSQTGNFDKKYMYAYKGNDATMTKPNDLKAVSSAKKIYQSGDVYYKLVNTEQGDVYIEQIKNNDGTFTDKKHNYSSK